MSRIITLTPEYKDEVRKDFEKSLTDAKMSDGKISFTKVFSLINRRAKLYFTEIAWQKMQGLIRKYDTEVGWHGVARRGEDPEKDEYIISDILLPYPQIVTGATVNTDQKEYDSWLFSEENDEVFNDIRFHGHSHVNMSTSPSGVDDSHWAGILSQLTNDMFYIFSIWNKRGDKTIRIYDLAKNVLFETSDVDVEIIAEKDGVEDFLKKSEERVKEKRFSSSSSVYEMPNNTANNKNNKKGTENKTDNKKNDKKNGKKKRKGKRVDVRESKQMTIFDDGLGGW